MRAVRAGDGVKLMNYMALMGAGVALVVGAFLVYTTMTMAITQRRPVISMLRAIGGRRTTIVRDLLAEAVILGLIGGAIGSGIGIVMGRAAIGRLPPAITQGLEARVEYWLPGYAIPVALAATVLTAVAASAMAARQVYKVSPIEALAPVGVSAADFVPRWLRMTSGIAAVAVFAASIGVVVDRHGSLAFVAIFALFSAEIALGFALTAVMVKATSATARIFGSVGPLAAATIERAPRRVWATVMTVLIAVVTTVVITGTNADMIRSARAIFAPVAGVDVWVSADPPDSYPVDALPQDLADKVAAVPGVRSVIKGASGFAEVGGTRVMLDGFSAGTADPLYRALDDQVRTAVLAGRGVVLSQNLGKTLHVRVGDKLQLQTPHGPRSTTVLALVPYFSTVIGTVGMKLDRMREWFDRPAATALQVNAAAGVDPNRLLADIRHAVPEPNYVYSGRTALAGLEAPLHQSMFIANAVWIIVVFVAAVALFNTLTLSVLERRREIGVLRAMGTSRRFTLRMILAEAAAIGIVGGICGLLFGLADQWLYSLVSGDMMNFTVRLPAEPDGARVHRGRAGDQPARLIAASAPRGATEHHRSSRRRLRRWRSQFSYPPQRPKKSFITRMSHSPARGSVKGMVNELSRAGSIVSTNVLTDTPAIPTPTSSGRVTPSEAKLSPGSIPDVNTSVMPRDGRFRIIPSKFSPGSAAPMSVTPKRASSGSVAEIKPGSSAGLMSSPSARAEAAVTNGMSPAARKAPAAVPRTSVMRRALIGDSNRE